MVLRMARGPPSVRMDDASATRAAPAPQLLGNGLVFDDELRQDISSYLTADADVEPEIDLLQFLGGTVCYSRPVDSEHDRWREARSRLRGLPPERDLNYEPSHAEPGMDVSSPSQASSLKLPFGSPPHSSELRWPPRPRPAPARSGRQAMRPQQRPEERDWHYASDGSDGSDGSEDGHRRSPHNSDSDVEEGRPVSSVSADELLEFTSCFESANLLHAVYVDGSYELVLDHDMHTRGHTQWFFFAVRNCKPGKVRFRVVNLAKQKSLFREGQQPVVWSERLAAEVVSKCVDPALWGIANEIWRPAGENIQYHRSHVPRSDAPGTCYYALSWDYTFEPEDTCLFFSFCAPFTYSMLRESLSAIDNNPLTRLWCRQHVLCTTSGDLRCDHLIISNSAVKTEKKVIVVSARVHPGESNSSWLIHGLIGFLLSDCTEAEVCRDHFIWHIIPMLNPDGVVCGNTRCCLAGMDLNRQWRAPHRELHGTVHQLKKMIAKLKKKSGLCMYLDLHGHSRKCGIFSYACANYPDDHRRFTVRLYPKILSMLSPEFAFDSCRWRNGRGKRGTGRVVVARDLGVTDTYTIEASFYGACVPGRVAASAREVCRKRFANPIQCEGDQEQSQGDSVSTPRGGAPGGQSDDVGRETLVLFTPAKLGRFGADLARAVLLHQRLGPTVRKRGQPERPLSGRSPAMSLMEPPSRPHTAPQTVPKSGSGMRAFSPFAPVGRSDESSASESERDSDDEGGDSSAVQADDLASPRLQDAFSVGTSGRIAIQQRATSPRLQREHVSDADSLDVSPRSDWSTRHRRARRPMSGGRIRLSLDSRVRPSPPASPSPRRSGKASSSSRNRCQQANVRVKTPEMTCAVDCGSPSWWVDKVGTGVSPFMDINISELLDELHLMETDEAESCGSDSDPSDGNLDPQELARLNRTLKRVSRRRRGHKKPKDTSSKARGRTKTAHGARRPPTRKAQPSAERVEREASLQRTVAFGQTTYVGKPRVPVLANELAQDRRQRAAASPLVVSSLPASSPDLLLHAAERADQEVVLRSGSGSDAETPWPAIPTASRAPETHSEAVCFSHAPSIKDRFAYPQPPVEEREVSKARGSRELAFTRRPCLRNSRGTVLYRNSCSVPPRAALRSSGTPEALLTGENRVSQALGSSGERKGLSRERNPSFSQVNEAVVDRTSIAVPHLHEMLEHELFLLIRQY